MGSPVSIPAQPCARSAEVDRFHALSSRSLSIERQADGRVKASSAWLPDRSGHDVTERVVQRRSAGDPKYVPDAWPALLSQDQLSAYVGMSREVLGAILTVRPLDLGARRVLYRRTEIDAWLATLPQRGDAPTPAPSSGSQDPQGESRTDTSLERVRARATGRRP